MADTTLRQAFSDIANAIRAKGVTGTMTPLQMPTKVASISSSKYGVSGDSVLGNVDQNGVLQPPSTSFSFTSSDILSIPSNGLYYKFYQNPALTSVSLPNLTSVGNYGMRNAFSGCTSLTSISFPSLTTISTNGMFAAFTGCWELTTVDLSNVTRIEGKGLSNAFEYCPSLKKIYLTKLSSAGSQAFDYAFDDCSSLELVDFSQATAVPALSDTNAFQNASGGYSIVVPDALYSTWIAATNWSDPSIVGHIVKASEYTPAS